MIDWFFSEEEEISTIPKWNILIQFRINEFLPSWILLNSIISIAYLPSFRKIQILKNIPHVTHTYTHTVRWTSRARVHRVCEIANFHVPKVPKALVSPTTRKLQGFQFVPFKSRRCFPPLRLIWCGVEIDRCALFGGRVKFDHRHTDLNYSARRNRKEVSLELEEKWEIFILRSLNGYTIIHSQLSREKKVEWIKWSNNLKWTLIQTLVTG